MDDPVELLKSLVSIDSVNPDLVPGGAGEAEVAAFCADWLAARGFEVHRVEEVAGRPSIVGIARGSGGGRSLMFNGHIDTVSTASYDGDALSPVIRDGKLFGRGSFDMKSGVAAMMVAAARAKAKGVRGDILVACVADEEYASFGTEQVVLRFKADAAIVTEPSHLELTIAHKGFVWFDVTVQGRAAHGSRPELGIDAIAKAGRFLTALEDYGRDLLAKPTHARLKSGSVHASLISGGEEVSSYPAVCRISLERRTVPGETPESVRAEWQAGTDLHRRRQPRRLGAGRFAGIAGKRARRVAGAARRRFPRRSRFQGGAETGAGALALRGAGKRRDRESARRGGDTQPRPSAGAARRAVLDRLRHLAGSRHVLRHVRRRRRRRTCGERMGDGGFGQPAGRHPDRHGARFLRLSRRS